MKRNYIAVLICVLAVVCIAATPYRPVADAPAGDERPIFGYWVSNLDSAAADFMLSTDLLVLRFMENEMRVAYCKNGTVSHYDVIDATYSDTTVIFVDCESKYRINGDTLHICLGDVDCVALRIDKGELPGYIAYHVDEKDSLVFDRRRTGNEADSRSGNWMKKGLEWILSWFD